MKKQPLVSIIMNCLNGEKYLSNAIDSNKTTYKNWELILDNQSTDNSASILKRYKDKKIKYFYSKKKLFYIKLEMRLLKNRKVNS